MGEFKVGDRVCGDVGGFFSEGVVIEVGDTEEDLWPYLVQWDDDLQSLRSADELTLAPTAKVGGEGFIYVIGDKVRCVGKTIFGHHNLEGTVKDVDYEEDYPILVSFLEYRDPVACNASDLELIKDEAEGEYTGGSSSYYDVKINGTEIRCLDIIEALNMNYAEGNAFKAVWRIAASKQGKQKKGNTRLYDAEKVAFFGERLISEHQGDV